MAQSRSIDISFYPLEAIEQAKREFHERCSISVTVEGDRRASVSVDAAEPSTILEFWNFALECSLIDGL